MKNIFRNRENIKLKLRLSKSEIVQYLALHHGVDKADLTELVDTDYEIWECCDTGFSWSEPMLQGSDLFYNWITATPNYYPQSRWEYEYLISKSALNIGSLLDVGCGDGKFLSLLPKEFKKYGIDFNHESVKLASAYGSIFQGKLENMPAAMKFDNVVAFHVLEHVEDPLGFINECFDKVKPGGKLILSTPNSPMYFEKYGIDIKNLPPHHLTRWTKGAYLDVASILGASVEIYYSPATKFLKRVSLSVRLSLGITGVSYQKSLISNRFIKVLIKSFLIGWKEILMKPSSTVILAVYTKE